MKIGATTKRLILSPNSPGVLDLIYIGLENTVPLLKVYSREKNTKTMKMKFWRVNLAKKGWISMNSPLARSFWHGNILAAREGKKKTMTYEEFLEWWATKQLQCEMEYWTADFDTIDSELSMMSLCKA